MRVQGRRLQGLFERIGRRLGLKIQVVLTDGRQPIGRGIGPVLEVIDVLQVLRRDPAAPQDPEKKSLLLSWLLQNIAL